jgi:hypothetical protein
MISSFLSGVDVYTTSVRPRQMYAVVANTDAVVLSLLARA